MWPILIALAGAIITFFAMYCLPDVPRLAGALETAATVGALFVVAYYTYETRQLRVASEKQLRAAHRPMLVIEEVEAEGIGDFRVDPGLRGVPGKQLCLVNHGTGVAQIVNLEVCAKNLKVTPRELAAMGSLGRVLLHFQDGESLDSHPKPYDVNAIAKLLKLEWREFLISIKYSDVLGVKYAAHYNLKNEAETFYLTLRDD